MGKMQGKPFVKVTNQLMKPMPSIPKMMNYLMMSLQLVMMKTVVRRTIQNNHITGESLENLK
jgi:hypothetical protein